MHEPNRSVSPSGRCQIAITSAWAGGSRHCPAVARTATSGVEDRRARHWQHARVAPSVAPSGSLNVSRSKKTPRKQGSLRSRRGQLGARRYVTVGGWCSGDRNGSGPTGDAHGSLRCSVTEGEPLGFPAGRAALHVHDLAVAKPQHRISATRFPHSDRQSASGAARLLEWRVLVDSLSVRSGDGFVPSVPLADA